MHTLCLSHLTDCSSCDYLNINCTRSNDLHHWYHVYYAQSSSTAPLQTAPTVFKEPANSWWWSTVWPCVVHCNTFLVVLLNPIISLTWATPQYFPINSSMYNHGIVHITPLKVRWWHDEMLTQPPPSGLTPLVPIALCNPHISNAVLWPLDDYHCLSQSAKDAHVYTRGDVFVCSLHTHAQHWGYVDQNHHPTPPTRMKGLFTRTRYSSNSYIVKMSRMLYTTWTH